MATERTTYIDPDNSLGTDYTSMDAFEDAWGGVANSGDCVGEDEWAHGILRCTGGTVDSRVVDFTGWTSTDATHYVLVETLLTEAYRHDGNYPASGNVYRMDTVGSSLPTITVRMNDVIIRGVANRCTAPQYGGAFEIRATADNVRIQDCVAWLSGTAADRYGFYVHSITSGSTCLIQNCLAYSFNGVGGEGFKITTNSNHTTHLQFCSAIDSTIGFSSGGSTTTALCSGCFTFNTTTAFSGTRFGASTNNCYDNGTDPGSNGTDISSVTEAELFVDYASSDFHFIQDNAVAGRGPDLRTASPYACTTDFEGDTRAAASVPHFDEVWVSTTPGPTAYEQLQDHVCYWSLDAVRRLDTYHPN